MRLAVMILGVCLAGVASAEGWVCTSEGAAGFTYNEKAKRWLPINFQPNFAQFVIRRSKLSSTAGFVVVVLGDDQELAVCGEVDKLNLSCTGFYPLKLDAHSLKFSLSYVPLEFWSDADWEEEATDAMFFTFGRCTPI